MHQVKDQLEAMCGVTVFTTFDLTKGYHQMKLAEVSKENGFYVSPGSVSMEGAADGYKDIRGSVPIFNILDAWEFTT